jgi:hypothetical protein
VNPLLGKPEHHEWRWFGYGEALERASPRLEPVVRWAGEVLGAELPPRAPRAGQRPSDSAA